MWIGSILQRCHVLGIQIRQRKGHTTGPAAGTAVRLTIAAQKCPQRLDPIATNATKPKTRKRTFFFAGILGMIVLILLARNDINHFVIIGVMFYSVLEQEIPKVLFGSRVRGH